MKALIVDDENKARRLLKRILVEKCPEITIILEASDLEEGVNLIKTEHPNLVYLDIEMSKYSGLQIFELLGDEVVDFQIIFTTAYNEYAVDAFKLSAIDYLLKPIDASELQSATQKAISAINRNAISTQLQDLKNAFNQLALDKIALEIPRGVIFISYNDIVLFEADGMYTKVYLANKNIELICKPLKYFVEQLSSLPFFYKPHRSFLVNLKHVTELSKKNGNHLVLNSSKTIPISKDRLDEFMSVVREVFKY